MIYTVTFNPSLDYIVSVNHFRAGEINRTAKELLFPGGKGINVSIVLRNLGFDNTALGFIAGFTGDEIRRRLDEQGIRSDFIRVEEGLSRINVKLRSVEKIGNHSYIGQETEINGMGPAIGQKDIEALYRQLDRLQAEDILVLSGSIPSVMPPTMYMDIMAHLQGRGIRIAVDASGDLLTKVLPYHPFLVKPNNHELGGIFGVTIRGADDAVTYARKLQELGARNVLVSMAGDGAVLVDENGREHRASAPKGKLKNSVGAGDSMVAGFIAGYLGEATSERNGSGGAAGDAAHAGPAAGNTAHAGPAAKDVVVCYERAFLTGLCAGSASAFSDELAKREEVEALLSHYPDPGGKD